MLRRQRHDTAGWADLIEPDGERERVGELAAEMQREAIHRALASDDPTVILPSGNPIPAWLAPTGEEP